MTPHPGAIDVAPCPQFWHSLLLAQVVLAQLPHVELIEVTLCNHGSYQRRADAAGGTERAPAGPGDGGTAGRGRNFRPERARLRPPPGQRPELPSWGRVCGNRRDPRGGPAAH